MRRSVWSLGFVAVVSALMSACGGDGGSQTPTNPSPPAPQPPQANRNPTINSMTVAPAFGIAALTQFNFSSAATDPDGDSLTYTWDLADGTTRTGATVIHNYGPSSFGSNATIRLTVADGRGGTTTETKPITVATMTGSWSGSLLNAQINVTMQQSASGSVTATWSIPSIGVSGILDPAAPNSIRGDGAVSLRFKVNQGGGFLDFTFNGQMQTSATRMTGGVTGSGFTGQSLTLNRL